MAVPNDAETTSSPPQEEEVDMEHTIVELTQFLTATNPRLRAVAVQNMVRFAVVAFYWIFLKLICNMFILHHMNSLLWQDMTSTCVTSGLIRKLQRLLFESFEVKLSLPSNKTHTRLLSIFLVIHTSVKLWYVVHRHVWLFTDCLLTNIFVIVFRVLGLFF